jgi:CHAT domain-containing protein/tetratricopeptide (TPR) repeat protein
MLAGLIAALVLLVPPSSADDAETERALLRQALALLAEQPMSRQLVETYEELHLRAWRQGQAEVAQAAIDRIVAWWGERYGDDSMVFANRLSILANRLHALGDYAPARPLHERVVAIVEATYGSEPPELATALINLGIVLKAMGEHAAARPLQERALAIREAALGPDHPQVAESLNSLGSLLLAIRDFDGARAHHERALAIRETALGIDHPAVAQSLFNLALLFEERGDFAEARPLQERALAIREAALGRSHPLVAASLNHLAVLLKAVGDYAAARPRYERALEIREEALGPDHPLVAMSLNALGILYFDLGDYAGARPLYERALLIRETDYGSDHPYVAESLNNLALLLMRVGDHAAARPLYERSLAIWEVAHGPEHPLVAVGLNNLVLLHRELGDFAAAKALAERCLRIREAALGSAHPQFGTALYNMGLLERSLGDLAAARPLIERGLAITQAALGPEHPRVVLIRADLVLLLLDAQDHKAAFARARLSAALSGQVRRTLASLTTGEAHLYLAKQRRRRSTALAAAAAVGDTAAAYATVLDAKGQVARLTLQTRAQIRGDLEPETLAMTESLGRLQERLSSLALKTDISNGDAHDALLELLRDERDALDRKLRRNLTVEDGVVVTAQNVGETLPAGSAVLDLLVHPTYIPATFEDGEFVEKGRWSEPRLGAWIVRADEDGVMHVDLGPVAPLEEALDEHLEIVTAVGLARGRRLETRTRTRVVPTALHSMLWAPLAVHLKGVDTVFVSPDGAFGKLPFETLQDSSGRFLVEDVAFVYVSDGGSIARSGTEGSSPGSSLLAVGDVDYDRRGDRPTTAGLPALDDASRTSRGGELARGFANGWEPLTATVAETTSIAAIHEDARHAGTRLLVLGADASEERLKVEMPRHAIVHLATHGYFQPEGLPSMWESALDAVNGERGMQMTETSKRVTGLHPGLLSGLVFAGANRPPGEDDDRDDGYLTASEVTLLDLSGVDLVVLSACETGLGRPQSGEGLLGLRRAFHMAGADTVVSSLWAVEDESTSELMQGFYRNLLVEGMGRHEALRAAQLDMLDRNRREHGEALPSTWGAFVLSGEWR